MAERPQPNVYTIPSGAPFTDELARGLLGKYSDDPLVLGSVLVLLPTRRACRSLRDSFLRVRQGQPLILPDIRPIADVDEEEISLHEVALVGEAVEQAADIPPAIPAMRRQLLLSRLILEMAAQREAEDAGGMDAAQAVALAAELASLLDQMQTERLSFSVLGQVVPDQLATHWQHTLEFLKILTEHWPVLLAAEGCIDPADRRNRLLELQARMWTESPPQYPVIAAGSTGTIPATADLLKVVATLPQGMVVLPGLDRRLDEESWRAIGETHYQFGMRRLLAHLGVLREDVETWDAVEEGTAIFERAALLTEAMRPAETSHAWRDVVGISDEAMSGVSRIDCPGVEEEARVVALVMREVLESPGRTAALVTPDRALARRVAAEVRRWDVEIDDSAGSPLGETVPGAFFRLVAQMATEKLAPIPLLAALKHPLAAGGMVRQEFRSAVRSLELAVLHGPRPAAGLSGLATALKLVDASEISLRLLERLDAALSPFLERSQQKRISISDLLNHHVAACEALAADDAGSGAARLWTGDAGIGLADFVDELSQAANGMAPVSGAEYPALLARLLGGRVVRPHWGRHPRLNIWGLLEARLQQADIMILAGLNEGTWPPEPATDPWLNRPMREAVGLPTPERRIGLTAHDFIQAVSAGKVYVTRAEKVNGTPTVPSRWLLRLEALLGKFEQKLDPDEPWLSWQDSLDAPVSPLPPAMPPEPRPPVIARPRRFSVTDIETWVRDPYSLYARRILKLRPLDPIDADPGVMERGIFIHRALEEFISGNGGDIPEDAVRQLIELGERIFGATLAQPAVGAFWWPRFQRIAEWFVDAMRVLVEREGVSPAAVEVRGEMALDVSSEPVTLVAKADRIDRRPDGSLAIVDYKTGTVPTQKEVALGLSPQLLLEAWIAESGRFAGIDPAEVHELAYWRLTGGAVPGEIHKVRGDTRDLIDRACAGLSRLITAFDDPETPYRARPRPRYALRYGDYDHLARVPEWAAGSGGETT